MADDRVESALCPITPEMREAGARALREWDQVMSDGRTVEEVFKAMRALEPSVQSQPPAPAPMIELDDDALRQIVALVIVEVRRELAPPATMSA